MKVLSSEKCSILIVHQAQLVYMNSRNDKSLVLYILKVLYVYIYMVGTLQLKNVGSVRYYYYYLARMHCILSKVTVKIFTMLQ